MKSRKLIVDESLQVFPEGDIRDYPMSIHEQPVGVEGYGNVPHWHSEAQFSYVTKGIVRFRAAGQEYSIGQGEGIFFNCNCIHEAVSDVPGDESRYLCIKFAPSLIYGQASSRIRSRYIDPIIYSSQLQAVPLQNDEWKHKICDLLERLTEAYEQEQVGYEIRVATCLMEIWLLLYENISPDMEETISISYSDKQRSETLHKFIHENYTEKITLDDIAGAAHVSRGECCRIFKRLHHTTPFQYLIRFRLSESIKLLSETDYSISQIAQQVGFGSSSYYTECFKRELHCTPHKYRQQLNHMPSIPEEKRYPFRWRLAEDQAEVSIR